MCAAVFVPMPIISHRQLAVGINYGITNSMTTVKTAISVRPELFRQVETICRKLGISRSQFFAQAAEEFIKRSQTRRLQNQINEAYAEEPTPHEIELLRSIKRKQRGLLEDKW
jgi:hypothetical protein